MNIPYHSPKLLKELVCIGHISFSVLVETLTKVGYIIETAQPEGIHLHGSAMERIEQEDFDELFRFFYPGTLNDIELYCIADDGGWSGCYTYALFNQNIVDCTEVLEKIKTENMRLRALYKTL